MNNSVPVPATEDDEWSDLRKKISSLSKSSG